MAKAIVWLTGLFFVLYGLGFTFAPAELAFLVTASSPSTSSGLIELRATSGGMGIAMGIIILFLAKTELSMSLLVTGVVLLAMASARVIGIAIDGSPNSIMIVYLVAELVAGVSALLLRNKA